MEKSVNHANIIRAFEEASLEELVAALTAADDYYHNTGEPIVEDNEYDIAKRYAHGLNPAHVYFTGVGSTVRGGKVKLPYQMGSLDQVEIGEITDWIGNWGLQKEDIVATDKLDGTSALIIYNDLGELQIAYSRGNGIEGADITRHISQIPSVPEKVTIPGLVVRAEVIISTENFDTVREIQPSRSGKPYKNPRNAVAGIMNAKRNAREVYKYIDVVAYETITSELARHSRLSKEVMLEDLATQGFITAPFIILEGRVLTDDTLTDHLHGRRVVSKYEIDGLVLDVDSPTKRSEMNPTRSTLNPAYAVKYKVASADNIKNVRVVEVEWNVSKHGYYKPRVRIEPTELMGVTIQHATGFNAKFIADNNIGAGAVITITRSGDVIPFITDVIEGGELVLPEGEWTETGVDLVSVEGANSDEARFKQVVDFFASIDAPNLKEGSVRKMFDNGFTSIEAIIEAEELDFIVAMGKNGEKAYEGLHNRLQDIYVHDFVGSLPFFDRGVGKRKFKKLFESISYEELVSTEGRAALTQLALRIESVEGFDTKTAVKITSGIDMYNMFMELVSDYVTFTVPKLTGVSMDGQKVVFTGFRDKALQAEVEANGGTMQSGVSGKTTILVAANPNSNSGKMKKARDNGTLIVGIDEFKEML